MPPDRCPYAPQIAARLADPAARLDADLARHLPQCEACRRAASVAIRAWPTDRSPSPSLAEWLAEPTANQTGVSSFQAEAIAGGRLGTLELGPYLLLDRLGAGGMGDVYHAWHRLLRREEAIKTVRPELASNPAAVKRFLREAEAAAKVIHPNVVQVYTADRTATGYYIAMEFVRGTDLGKLIRADGALAPLVACDYIRQAADGLHRAYASGLVHRDVKPANLLVTADRRTVKVADFGLARAFEGAEASEMTASGTVLGTTDYMAPEQADDARAADTRADVYALGCTLYFLLTAEVPYPGGSVRNKLERHATAPLPDVLARRPDVPPAVGAIVRKCLAKHAADRYQTPGELSAALRAFVGAEWQSRQPPPPPTVVRVASFEPSATEPQREVSTAAFVPEETREYREPAQKPNRPWVWACGFVVVAGAAVAAILASQPNRREESKGEPPPDPATLLHPSAPPKGAAPATPPPKPPPRVPLPSAAGAAPWKFTTACWSDRKDTVRAVGFLDDGTIVAGRDGDKKDGSDAGFWEVWAPAGGAAIRSVRPTKTANYEYPVWVHPQGVVTDRFRRFDPITFNPVAPLATNLASFGRENLDGIDALRATLDNKFLAGTVVPLGDNRALRLVVLWEAGTGKVSAVWPVKTSEDLKTVATDRTGSIVATGTREGRIAVMGTGSGGNRDWAAPNTAKGAPNAVGEVALSPDGKKLYSSHTGEHTVLVWNVSDGRHESTLSLDWLVHGLTVSPNGRWLATTGDAVVVWDLEAKPPVPYELAQHWAGDLLTVAFSGDGTRLVVGGWARRGNPPEVGEGVVWLWDHKP